MRLAKESEAVDVIIDGKPYVLEGIKDLNRIRGLVGKYRGIDWAERVNVAQREEDLRALGKKGA